MSTILTIIITVLASSGFWAFIQYLTEKKGAKSKMLMGISHDRLMYLSAQYIERGKITKDEYENLHDYLYKPYKKLGGNGACDRIMREVDKLPIEL